jgi:shikimate kinase
MPDLPAEPPPTATDRPVVLVGLMGAGKTSVAIRLAEALGRPLRDSDQDLQRRYGQSAAELYQRYGVAALHDREAAVLIEALAADPPPVIAAAASVIEDPRCRAALAGAFVVWLDAPPDLLADRFRAAAAERGDHHRPEYHPDPETMLADQHRRRAGWFRELADLVVDAADTTPDRAAGTVLAALAGPSRPD